MVWWQIVLIVIATVALVLGWVIIYVLGVDNRKLELRNARLHDRYENQIQALRYENELLQVRLIRTTIPEREMVGDTNKLLYKLTSLQRNGKTNCDVDRVINEWRKDNVSNVPRQAIGGVQ